MTMFEPGDRVNINFSDDTGAGNWEVVEYDDGLLKVRRNGNEIVYNLRSTALKSVQIVNPR